MFLFNILVENLIGAYNILEIGFYLLFLIETFYKFHFFNLKVFFD